MKHPILIILVVSLFSCNAKSDETTKTEIQRKIEIETKRENLNKIAKEFGAISGFDKLDLSLTLEYQRFFEKNNKIILDEFEFDDVLKKDSEYLISIHKGDNPKYFFELKCDSNQVQQLLADYSLKDRNLYYNLENLIVVASITSIKKIKFKIETNVERSNDGDDEPDVNFDLNNSNNFILEGRLINLNKNL